LKQNKLLYAMDLTCKLHSTTELQQSYTIRPKYACTLLGAVVD